MEPTLKMPPPLLTTGTHRKLVIKYLQYDPKISQYKDFTCVCLSVCPCVHVKRVQGTLGLPVVDRKGLCVRPEDGRPAGALTGPFSLTFACSLSIHIGSLSASLPGFSPQLQVNNISNLRRLTNNS